MSVSVTMPRLGESVSEGTVTRWLKREGEQVEADEPLLEVSTDKVDTEIPAPASGVLAAIKVGEDETVEVGAELATIDDGSGGSGGSGGSAGAGTGQPEAEQQAEQPADQPTAEAGSAGQVEQEQSQQAPEAERQHAQQQESTPEAQQQQAQQQQDQQPQDQQPQDQQPQAQPARDETPAPEQQPAASPQPAAQSAPAAQPPPERADGQSAGAPAADGDQGAYVTPLVRKLAAEHNVDLATISGTGVGGRIRKQDVLDAARAVSPATEDQAPQSTAAAPPAAPAEAAPAEAAPARQPAAEGAPVSTPAAELDERRGRTEKMSRLRTVIAERMVESLRVSAQLTTVVEADISRIARLRQRAKDEFEAREGVKLSYLPFFALATVEALKAHPNVNASIDVAQGTITYHDAEHLGIAVDTERGLLVPVIHNAGDLNLSGLARKIADLAERTRAGKVSPDELGGGTFTLTNTGSRGALFDTPIINQPQVGILGTGAVVKRPVVVDDAELGEVIAVRSMVYLALTYDHRLVDGADAARFLATIKERLEGGRFEKALGL